MAMTPRTHESESAERSGVSTEDIDARRVHRDLLGPEPPHSPLGDLIVSSYRWRPDPGRLQDQHRRADMLARRFALMAECHGHSGALALAAAIAGLPTVRRRRAA